MENNVYVSGADSKNALYTFPKVSIIGSISRPRYFSMTPSLSIYLDARGIRRWFGQL